MQPASHLRFPDENTIYRFLKKDWRTQNISSDILTILAKRLSNQSFNSVEKIEVKVTPYQLENLHDALRHCVMGNSPFPCPVMIRLEKKLDKSISNDKPKSELLEEKLIQAFQHAEKNNIQEILNLLSNLEKWLEKNKLCQSVANCYAKKGDFEHTRASIIRIDSIHGSLDTTRLHNYAYKEVAEILAQNGFIEESIKCIKSIQGDYSKYYDSEYSPSLISEAWDYLLESLIEQRNFKEANKHLWHASLENRYNLEVKIKKGLGTWVEPYSVSDERYYSYELHRDLTIEELTKKKIEKYAENRALKELDLSECKAPGFFSISNFDNSSKWQEKKRKERELLFQKFLEEFDLLSSCEKCQLLRDFVKVDGFSAKEELQAVISYIKRVGEIFIEAVD